MTAKQTAVTLIELASGDKKSFPKKQARRILDLQKRTGLVDYKEDDEPSAKASDTPKNADIGLSGDRVNSETSKRDGTQTGG